MAQYGTLTRRFKDQGEGKAGLEVFIGSLIVPDLITGQVAIAERSPMPDGAKMTHVVKVNQGSGWGEIGLAMFKRRNDKSAWYMVIKVDTPLIQAKLGDALWLNAFPEGEGKNMGKRGEYDAEDYHLVWSGSAGGAAKSSPAMLDDEIPF